MGAVTPDTSVYAENSAQPEFTELMWQYINRRCSGWRVMTGKERAKEYAGLLSRIEKDYGVDRYILLGLWGMESSYGDVVINKKYMRQSSLRSPPSPGANHAGALLGSGIAQCADNRRSRLGATFGHDRILGWSNGYTQWMPEVWLNMGVDYDHDGRASPFGKPDNSLAGTAHYLVERGNYRRGEAWGCEVTMPAGRPKLADNRTMRSYAKWQDLGVHRADGAAFSRPSDQVKLWLPVAGGPAFLVGQNFRAVYSYNPSSSYALALCHLGDLSEAASRFVNSSQAGSARRHSMR